MSDQNRLKTISGALVVLLAILTVGAAIWILLSPAQTVKDQTWERIQQDGLMRVGMDASYPPFEFFDQEGNLVGFDVDLARELAGGFGVNVDFVIISFDGLYDALRIRRVDLILSALPLDPRLTEDVTYSHPYFNAGQVLAVREDDAEVTCVDDLAARKVGVEWGSMGDVEARQLLRRMEFELFPYPSPEEALAALSSDEIDAVIVDTVSVYQSCNQGNGIKIVGPPVTDDPYVIATLLGSYVLQERLNESILEMSASGYLDQLRVKWF
ncbi:MAG TPA: amino acid ABC transporter substrate-binding protein [Chloroflexi bacterium]|nr:amino acid ABC transporter substrate-binding protein [Chloroflexota bacterium]